jgi:hypothetical protein
MKENCRTRADSAVIPIEAWPKDERDKSSAARTATTRRDPWRRIRTEKRR